MKNFQLFFLVLILPLGNLFSQVQKITWRGWENCYSIKNPGCEVIINASAGGKVVWFALNGKNVIFENPQQDGKTLTDWQQNRFDPDGGRFDVGPEKTTQPIHALTWLGAWKAEIISNNTIRLTSAPDTLLGLQTAREYSLHSDSAILSIKLSTTNITSQPLIRHFWGRTLLIPGGKLYMPLNPKSRFEKGWARFLWNPENIDVAPHADGRIKFELNTLIFMAEGTTIKGGTDAVVGWMGYEVDSVFFKKRFPVFANADYSGSENMTTIFYSNGKFIE